MSLHVHDLVSGYGRSTVLHGVSFELRQGTALGLLGRNGVGKSTLALTLAALLPARSGSVRLAERELTGLRADQVARAGVSLVPQGRRVWAPLTVEEHLRLAASRSRTKDPVWTYERVFDVFPRLAQRRRHAGGQLSGGEQQMLAIARSLLTNPALVVLDEPSDGLAPSVVEGVCEMLREMRASGVTVLLIEQDLHLAFAVCDDIAVMEKGVIVHATDTPSFRRDPETASRLLGVA